MPIKSLCAALVSVALLACALHAQTLTAVRETGPRANRINIVYIAEGYTAAEQGVFAGDAAQLAAGVLADEFFGAYAAHLNIYRIFVASNDSGADEPDVGIARDTYFDSFVSAGMPTVRRMDRVHEALALNLPDYDLAIVCVNASAGGHASLVVGGPSIITLGIGRDPNGSIGTPVALQLHEFGHGFGGLVDEYRSLTNVRAGPESANIWNEANPATVPWRQFLSPSVPVPTTERDVDGPLAPGIFAGVGASDDVYRWAFNSRMNGVFSPWGGVNLRALQAGLNRLDLDRATAVPAVVRPPASGNVTAGQRHAFSVEATGSGPLTYQWAHNGRYLSGAITRELVIYPVVAADAGSYTVEVTNGRGTVTSAAATLNVTPASVPAITISGGRGVIPAGTATASLETDTFLGWANVSTGTITHTYTIQNPGAAPLQIQDIRLEGDPTFTLAAPPATTVPAGGSTTFAVRVDPAAETLTTAFVNVASNDPARPVYTFGLQAGGTQASPDALFATRFQVHAAAAGEVTFAVGFNRAVQGITADSFLLGTTGSISAQIAGITTTSLEQTGETIAHVRVSHSRASGSVRLELKSSGSNIRAGAVSYDGSGVRSAAANIAGGAADATPILTVTGNGQVITGSAGPLLGDGTHFGIVNVRHGSVHHSFRIRNDGNSTLTISSIGMVSGELNFVVSSPPRMQIPAGESTGFTVTYNPRTASSHGDSISIRTNVRPELLIIPVFGHGTTEDPQGDVILRVDQIPGSGQVTFRAISSLGAGNWQPRLTATGGLTAAAVQSRSAPRQLAGGERVEDILCSYQGSGGALIFEAVAPDGAPYPGAAPTLHFVAAPGSLRIPVITEVRRPSDGQYFPGNTLEFAVTFDRAPIVVSGAPRIPLQIGSAIRYATFQGMAAPNMPRFTYVVSAEDDAPAGLRRGEAVELNGGTITYQDRAPSTLNFAEAGMDAAAIDLSGVIIPTPVPPRIAGLLRPAAGVYYSGDYIVVGVNFDREIAFTGQPRLALQLGPLVRHATARWVSGRTIAFIYTIVDGETAPSGISVGSAIELNGGTITARGVPAQSLVFADAGIPASAREWHEVQITSRPTPAPTPTLWPLTVTGTEGGGQAVMWRIRADGSPTSFTATSLPPAMTLHNGVVAGASVPRGTYTATFTASTASASSPPTPVTFVIGENEFPDRLPGANDIGSISVPAAKNYRTGDVLTFVIQYPRRAAVLGRPRLQLTLGAQTRFAELVPGGQDDGLVFRYTVAADDRDDDGLSLAPGTQFADGQGAIWGLDGGSTFPQTWLTLPDTRGIQINAGDAPPPLSWQNRDIGAVAAAGSSGESGGRITVHGSGADIWETRDEFHFRYVGWTGDGEMIARVEGLTNTNGWAKAGLMFRETLEATSRHATMFVSSAHGTALQSRLTSGGGSASTAPSESGGPLQWVRIVRRGDTFTGYSSMDGATWREAGSVTIPMTSAIYAGFAVTSHNDGTLCTAMFANVAMNGASTPSPLPAPTSLGATAVSQNEISLAWVDSGTDEDGFEVERSTDGVAFTRIGLAPANATAFASTGLSAGTSYTYRVRATRGEARSGYSNPATATTPAPAMPPPGNLSATAVSSERIDLAWTDAGSSEDGYRIERSTAGGGFAQIATTDANGLSYSDTGLAAGTSYTYRVRASYGSNNSAYSNETSATTPTSPPPPPPADWLGADIGAVGMAGSHDLSGGSAIVRGAGSDIWEGSDSFRFVYRPLSGDGAIVARVTGLTNTHAWAKAGVMIRESLAAGARNTFIFLTPANGLAVQNRAVAGGATTATSNGRWGQTAPQWLRLTRTGNTIAAAWSSDGTAWVTFATFNSGFGSNALAGLAVTSHNQAALCTATFTNVAFNTAEPPPPPPGVPTAPTNLSATAVSAAQINLTWTDASSNEAGFEVERSTDNLAFSLRVTTAAGATAFADTGLEAATVYYYRVRAVNSAGRSAYTNVASTRTNDAPPPPPPPPTWQARDIGAVGRPGSASAIEGGIALTGSGEDIWNASDEFQYYYQTLTGDGELIARVTGLTNTHGWAKAGVMFRETLDPGSAHALMCVSAEHGTAFQYRATAGGQSATSTPSERAGALRWVRLVRSGNTITGYESENGTSWTLVMSRSFTFPGTLFVGLAVTSHNDAAAATATFTNITLSSGTPPPPPPVVVAAPSNLAAVAASSTQINLSWSDNSTNETGFEIERSVGGGSFSPLAAIGADRTGYSDTTVASGTNYTYRVRAVAGTATSSYSNSASATPSAQPPPPPPTPWSFGDIGAVGVSGSNSSSGNTITIGASGSDIWDTADSFRFIYRAVTGDGVVEAQVTSLQNTDGWAKAGVMIRESLATGSRNAFAFLTPAHGVTAQSRVATGGVTNSVPGPLRGVPYWVRLTRSGETFTAAASPDGVTWTTYATFNIPMNATVFFGFAVTSHSNNQLNTAVFTEPFVR